MFWIVASTVAAFFMATMAILVRLKAAKKPVSVKKIILPPIFMSTGAFMFIFPIFRVEWIQVIEAIVVGMVFSIFLIKTTTFEIKADDIYITPSKAFIFILFGLLIVRVVIKLILGQSISLGETSGMFFLLAFGMIATWRLAMLYKYKQLERKLNLSKSTNQLG
ncbi:CcdC family protein [Ornithinibacillus halophilus]|uniref:Membrane protein CcdC involved in cytochrome C biogenesis n=1 Tax=Ornithinibacillus halophilus TaxID=930117 RepID=A0A1M5CGX8_9BACI|nr:cytochrome c biogenesis protein CcdC [Ornithinibacillus halophilus]SHF53931.1 Membrane protein CcdC involved in cytochrome C biogenesis [Ornithinibacillus halophilus]